MGLSDSSFTSAHAEKQREYFNHAFAAGPRGNITGWSAVTDYVTCWRMREAVRRLRASCPAIAPESSTVLVVGAAEAYEASVLYELGFRDITVSDISEVAVQVATERDPRLRGMVLNAERMDLLDGAYDVVVGQDFLHHLQCPVTGFTEMLRVARRAVIFIDPHRSLVGSVLGKTWERNGDAETYVFRWSRRLLRDVAASYLGRDGFLDFSFSFCHHNVVFGSLARTLGNGAFAIYALRTLKAALDTLFGRWGNHFCGLLVRRSGNGTGSPIA